MSNLHEPSLSERDKLLKEYGPKAIEHFEAGLSKGQADDAFWSKMAARLRDGESLERVLDAG
tara:strand:+ start:276 stop:461 length:186 start_codon:yes stop_codon:yes gene_type:complete